MGDKLNIHAVIGSIFLIGFKILNWKSLRVETWTGKRVIKRIIKVKGFRTALIENYYGSIYTVRFYWRIGKYHL